MNVREKLVELIVWIEDQITRGYPYTTDQSRIETTVDHLIANGVTVQEWIPVTEKLPEDDLPKDSKVKQIKVLVAYKTNGRWVERTQIRVKGYWFREPDKWSWAKTSDPISHWMPLPEPPKEDNCEILQRLCWL